MIKVVFMGTPDVAVPVLHDLNQNSDNDVLAVYTSPDRQSGRGRVIKIPPVKSYAVEHDLEVSQPVTLRNPIVQQELAKLNPDVIIVGTGASLILPKIDLMTEIAVHGIGLEIMDTPAACRTYNVLVYEQRAVVLS